MDGLHRGGGAVFHLKLGIDLFQMLGHRAGAAIENRGYIAVGLALGQPAQHLGLAVGEREGLLQNGGLAGRIGVHAEELVVVFHQIESSEQRHQKADPEERLEEELEDLGDGGEGAGGLDSYISNLEREAIMKALQETRYNKTAAAKKLGITFRALRYKLKKLGID